ncbi:TIGR00180 family glycosyltransferase [Candidatus Pelagibacter sp.]|jgi:glycosyltransferase domain-containing protein|nr:TIGR00180 family glycosyltransferase [Candidatus Pelagibacter sp.]
MSITILIPTKNRHLFLDRILKFYSLSNLNYNLIVIDSSDASSKIKNLAIIKKYNKLNLKYYFTIGWTTEVMRHVSKKIKTKYCCFAGDDDFVIKDGLQKCETFLNKDKSFIGCMGNIILYNIQDKNKFINEYSSINKRIETNSYDRVINHINDYSVLHFSLTRSKYFKEALNSVAPYKMRQLCPSRHVNDEYILSFSLAALGKFEKIDALQVVRVVGHQNHIKITYNEELNISVKYMFKKLNFLINKTNKHQKLIKKNEDNFLENFKNMVIKKEKKQNYIFFTKNFLKMIKFYNFIKMIKKFFTNNRLNNYKKKYKSQLKIFHRVHNL